MFLGSQHNFSIFESQLVACADVDKTVSHTHGLPDQGYVVISMFIGFKRGNYIVLEGFFETYVKEVCGPAPMSVQTFLLLIFSCYSGFFINFSAIFFFSIGKFSHLRKQFCFILGCP